jgi:HAE1 family hydrophobic/amphiphilic exporter-1
MKLAEFSVKRPVTVIMIFLAIFILGAVSLQKLPLDNMPEIEPPSISVLTPWPGASAEDVETKVTRIVENNLSIINNLDEMTSISREGLSMVTCKFDWGTNLDEASNDIRDRLEWANRILPDDIEQSMIFKFNTSMFPILFFGVTADESWEKMYDLVDDEVVDALKRIPGVGAVQLFGGLRRQINVEFDRNKLAAYGLSLKQVEDVLREENLTLPAGSIKIGRVEYTIRVPGEYLTPAEIRDIVIKRDGGAMVYMRDVAEVSDSFEEQKRFVEINGRSGAMMIVQKRSGANTEQVARRVKEEVEKIKPRLPRDMKLYKIMDSSEFIVQSLGNLRQTILWGSVFVILTTLFFLRNIRTSFINIIVIPFSLIISFVFMYFMGWTLNVMTLAALSIALGMVVDNATVVLENIISHVERGQKSREAAVFGTDEVGVAISASTLTTIVIFLPLVFLTGIAGILFKQLGAIITITLVASLFCAVTLTPMLSSRLLKSSRDQSRKKPGRFYHLSESFLTAIETRYETVLAWALGHKIMVIGLAVLIFAGSLFMTVLVGSEFSPEQDTGDISITAEMAVGTRVEVTNEMCRRIVALSRQVAGDAAIEHIFFRAGESEGGIGSAFGDKEGTHIGEINLKLVKMSQRDKGAKDISRAILDQADKWPEIMKISAVTGDWMNQMLMGGGKPLTIEILGHDLEKTDKLAAQIKKIVEETPGAKDAIITRDLGKPELLVKVNRQKAASMGLNITQVTEALRTQFYGKEATTFREGENEYDIFMRLPESQRQSVEDLRNAEIVTRGGLRIRLDSIAEIVEELGPTQIDRKNQQRIVKVAADTYERSLGEVYADIRDRVQREVTVPQGVEVTFAGLVEEQQEAFGDLKLMMILGIVLVYMVMASQFESLLDPFVIMFSVPFAFTGVIWAMLLTGTTLNIMTFIGLIMLIGIVVNNAIVLIDYTNILRARNYGLYEAVCAAGRQRLRPVLITTATTVLGMLPLALSFGEGSESWRPLGIVCIGGLTVSTVVTLVLVPTIYFIFERFRSKNEKNGAAKI